MFTSLLIYFYLNLFLFNHFNIVICQQPQAPYDTVVHDDYGRINNEIIDPFLQPSLENVQLFKTKIFKLIEAQNQYFEMIQQKRPSIGDYDYVKFDILLPDENYRLDSMNGQKLISIPQPNLPKNNSQLLLSIDQANKQVNVWQFKSDSIVAHLGKYHFNKLSLPLIDDFSHYKSSKLKSYIKRIDNSWSYCLKIIILFENEHIQDDFIVILSLNFVINSNQDVILQANNLIDEQIIKFENIIDFDLLYQQRRSKNKIYLSILIENNSEKKLSNYKYELLIYHWLNEENIFDKIAWQLSDYVLNGRHVKLIDMDGSIYVICSYTQDSMFIYNEDFIQNSIDNYINVFKLIEYIDHRIKDNCQQSYRLVFVSSVNNVTNIDDEINEIHHLTLDGGSGDNNFIFIIKSLMIDVYWWDGQSLLYYDTIEQLIDNSMIKSFMVSKLPNQPPLILSTNGATIKLYYKIYSKFVKHELKLMINEDYGDRLEQIEIFQSNYQYFIWMKFFNANSNHYYCQFSRVRMKKPESNEQIYNLDTCLSDLRERIDQGLQTVQTLKRKSENLLVISPEYPYVDVDVYVDTLQTAKIIPEKVSLKIPGKIMKGERVVTFLSNIDGRIDHLENRLNHSILLHSINQTITSPLEFMNPIAVDYLSIKSMNHYFYLNDVNFDTYANGTLSLNGDQEIEIPVKFMNNLNINQFYAEEINGIPMKNVLLVSANSSIQYIDNSIDHHYSHIKLLNGTNTNQINDIQLIDLYQSNTNQTIMLSGEKFFKHLIVEQILIDTNLNGLNFKQLLSEIIWLDDTYVNFQEFNGVWTIKNFNHNYLPQIHNLTIINLINNYINFNYFIENVATYNLPELIIENSLIFDNFINIDGHLLVENGLINGLNLIKDVLLSNYDQDFSNIENPRPLVFETGSMIATSTKFANLTIELINGRYRPQTFLLRRKPQTKFYLRRKYFQNHLLINGNVLMRPNQLTNNVDLSDIYHQLDTMIQITKPLIVKQIIVGQKLISNYFNQYDWLFVQEKLSNVLLKNQKQKFSLPLKLTNLLLSATNLTFDYYGQFNLRFPVDFVHKNDENIEIIGRKYFQQLTTINNIMINTNATINGVRINEHFESIVYSNQNQPIRGWKIFDNLIINGNVHIEDQLLNNHGLISTIDVNDTTATQTLQKALHFTNVVFLKNFSVIDLSINRSLNGINYELFWKSTIKLSSLNNLQPYTVLKLHNKHFPHGLNVYSIQMIDNATIDFIPIHQLIQWSIPIANSTKTIIDSNLYFMNATFENIKYFNTINGLSHHYFQQVLRKDSFDSYLNIHPYNNEFKIIYGDWNVKYLTILNNGRINNYDITSIEKRVLKKTSTFVQNITSKLVFLKPLSVLNLTLPIHMVHINQIPLKNYVWLHNINELVFNTNIVFENIQTVQNINVYGLINRCYFNHLIETSIKHQQTLDGSVVYNLTGRYYTPKIIIRGNVRFFSLINNQHNFIPYLMNNQHPIQNGIEFLDEITINHIYINNIVNQRNISILFTDAVVNNRAQEIHGRKIFLKPLKIYGNIDQAINNQLTLKQFNHYRNFSNLFQNLVNINTFNRSHIYGHKIFTGNITFGHSIRFVGAINGLHFPNDFILTYTNETINQHLNFNRKVHLHRNLNVQLINHINITKFVHNGIMIDQTTKPQQMLSTLHFKDPIRIKNLTVFHRINDISVDDLLFNSHTTDQKRNMIKITGKKIFNDPLIINGNLNIRTNQINNVNLLTDLNDQWIDKRNSHNNNSTIINTKLIFDQPIHVGRIHINQTLNNIPVREFHDNLKRMENDIGFYRQQIERSIRETNEKMILKNFTSNYINDLKHFQIHQTLPLSIRSFHPIRLNSPDPIAMILNYESIQNRSSNVDCMHQKSSHYYHIERQTGQLYNSNKYWPNISIEIVQSTKMPEILVLLITKCTENQRFSYLQFWQTYEFITRISSNDPMDMKLLLLSNKFYNIELIEDQATIESFYLFVMNQIRYVLVYYRLSGAINGNIILYKLNSSNFQLLDQKFGDIISYDIIELPRKVLLSTIKSKDYDQTREILVWNDQNQMFQSYYQFTEEMESYYSQSRFILFNDRLLVLYIKQYSAVLKNQKYRNAIEIYEIVEHANRIKLERFQQILINLLVIDQIEFVSIDMNANYLILKSNSIIQFYRFNGRKNLFEKYSEIDFHLPHMSKIKYYTFGDYFYLAVSSTSTMQTIIISSLISGRLNGI